MQGRVARGGSATLRELSVEGLGRRLAGHPAPALSDPRDSELWLAPARCGIQILHGQPVLGLFPTRPPADHWVVAMSDGGRKGRARTPRRPDSERALAATLTGGSFPRPNMRLRDELARCHTPILGEPDQRRSRTHRVRALSVPQASVQQAALRRRTSARCRTAGVREVRYTEGVQIRSYRELDFALAWTRVLTWARGGSIDPPDRLPFEVLARLYGDNAPGLQQEHHLSPVTLVMSSKKSGTSRPLTRLSPADLTLYQALVDKLAPDIEQALPSRGVVFARRQTLGREAEAFAGSPGRASYESAIARMFDRSAFDRRRPTYALTTDVAGYFLHVDIDELERQLYTASRQATVVRDLTELLRIWQTFGIRGLPQGTPPSQPLGNLYLTPVDRVLLDQGIHYVRWIDDLVIGAQGFHEARRVQDDVERAAYSIGLTLAADKTRIVRADAAVADSESAKGRLARIKRARLEAAEDWLLGAIANLDYPPDEEELPDPGDLEREAVVETYDALLARLEDDALPRQFHSLATEVLRDLAALKHVHALERIPRLLERAPDQTAVAINYLAHVADHALPQVIDVIRKLLARDRFVREYEKLAICHGVLALPAGRARELAGALEQWARHDGHELVRARALLAWGAHSLPMDFTVTDEFWSSARRPWRPYALVAIQGKDRRARDERYDNWSGEGRFLGDLARALKGGTFGWRKL